MMPKLIFTKATPTNPGRDGMDVIFTYQVEESNEAHTIHMVGTDNHWNSTQEEKNQYAQFLFAGALFVIETLWDRSKQLPEETKEFFQQDDFPVEGMTLIPWQGYTLILKE